MKKNHDIIDLFKWICAWLVVYIHIYPVFLNAPLLDTFIANGISRLAVPFFFSVSMFFLFQKLENAADNREKKKRILLRFSKRILITYLGWAGLYYAYHVFNRIYNGIEYLFMVN